MNLPRDMKDLDLATEQLRIFRHAATLLASSLEFEATLANTVQAFLPARLLVDDNADAAHMLATFLQAAGGHYTEVCQGAPAALEWLHNASFDVCLLDIGLPDMDGNELARHVRQHGHAQAPRLTAISGYGQERDRQQAYAAGFNHYLVKPVDSAQLLSLLDAADYSPGIR